MEEMKQVTIHKAKTTLSRLIAQVEQGNEIVVCRGQTPVVKIVAYNGATTRRPRVGEITTRPVVTQPDCFEPLSKAEMAEWGME